MNSDVVERSGVSVMAFSSFKYQHTYDSTVCVMLYGVLMLKISFSEGISAKGCWPRAKASRRQRIQGQTSPARSCPLQVQTQTPYCGIRQVSFVLIRTFTNRGNRLEVYRVSRFLKLVIYGLVKVSTWWLMGCDISLLGMFVCLNLYHFLVSCFFAIIMLGVSW